mmetsp:Transcript_47852/g.154208  ORF Transcript_47852/g.154208 Transcript_47852/m.154208 type:complete len:236 (+) Transcript_47852:4477-5184(+)
MPIRGSQLQLICWRREAFLAPGDVHDRLAVHRSAAAVRRPRWKRVEHHLTMHRPREEVPWLGFRLELLLEYHGVRGLPRAVARLLSLAPRTQVSSDSTGPPLRAPGKALHRPPLDVATVGAQPRGHEAQGVASQARLAHPLPQPGAGSVGQPEGQDPPRREGGARPPDSDIRPVPPEWSPAGRHQRWLAGVPVGCAALFKRIPVSRGFAEDREDRGRLRVRAAGASGDVTASHHL